jgi:hypothetical protein
MKSVIIIGGAQRSGTTLFQTLMANALPQSPVLSEDHILCDIIAAYNRAKVNWHKTSIYYETRDDLYKYFSKIALLHIDNLIARYQGSEYFVLKDPSFSKYLNEISEILPDSNLFLCVRDPRDIVASYIKIGIRDKKNSENNQYADRNISFICKRINQAYNTILKYKLPSRLIIVKYEDLVINTNALIRSLSKQAHLPLEIPDYNQMKWLDDHLRHTKTWITELERHSPSSENIGNYKMILSNQEKIQIEQECMLIFKMFEYRTDN